MSKHTPGPWTTNYVGTYGHVVRGANANIQIGNILPRGDFLTTDEAKANARLIAAAPDLLEALQSCLAMLERADCSTGYCCCGSMVEGHGIADGHGPVDDGDYHQCAAMDKARAAIAKATGE